MTATALDASPAVTPVLPAGGDTASTSMIKLKSSDGKDFDVDLELAGRIPVICRMLEQAGLRNETIPLFNVSSSTLAKVLKYCEHHRADPDKLPLVAHEEHWHGLYSRWTYNIHDPWDMQLLDIGTSATFPEDAQCMFRDLAHAAHFLELRSLFDLACWAVAQYSARKVTSY